jgi:hypothetical protein
VVQDPSALINVTYSNILGGFPGEGNIDADPLFMDLLKDARLRVGSPSMNSGNSDEAPSHDLLGMERDRLVDMGAYEVAVSQ